ncbi:MAG: LUD domain-containing protein [Proteobacteria bacterium]|nr:LUD domain-containing protein [Pseudomonadota bacterium]MBU1581762.1 LUD domain-containing protein [Pseudomonadota bacterium]MBU2455552.1 LUD domain-containing protein [Pseudomonadota bacterium]
MEKKESFKEYKDRLDTALENDFLRTAMDNFAVAYRTSRVTAFLEMDVDAVIKEVAAIKADAVKNNDRLLSRFISKAKENGITVHLADTAEDANRIISQIAEQTRSKKIVKSKSMTAEEIHLNQWLENKGLEVTETDLGEWIVQLRKEGPSHMVMPAIHLSRHQVAELFSDVTKKHQDSEIENLVKVARRQLREKYIQADMGITGANYAIAETGTLGIVTNEGNARLVSTLPKVHVALVGIDKLVPSIKDALSINRILPRNATGQAITSYVTWITGPSECKTAPEEKRQMHIVFLDNGRKKIAQDPVFAQVLQCVRCGACANVCPVYRMVGGHRMGYIYIGAIGLITTYFFHGSQNAKHLVQNCTNCGACKAVCAGGIDLPRLIKEIHSKIQDELGHPLKSLLLGKMLKNRKLFHRLLRTASLAQKPMTGGTPYLRHLPMIFSKDHNFRILPAITDKPFRDRFESLCSPVKKPTCRIAIFSGCVQDFVYPEHLEAAMELFHGAGVQVEFPMDQSCCGLPALMMGEKQAAVDVGLSNIKAFKNLDVDYIVTLCASCASHLKNHVPDLVENYAAKEAAQFSEKIMVLSQFINKVMGINHIKNTADAAKTAFHSPCHLCRGLGIRTDPKTVIAHSGHDYVKTDEEETCCGFGGSFSVNFPGVSKEILTRKLDDVEKSGATLLVTECPGCVMQLEGGALKQNRNFKVKHLSQILQPSRPSST